MPFPLGHAPTIGVGMRNRLVAEVDALCPADAASLADGEAVVELHRQLERLKAVAHARRGRVRRGPHVGGRRGPVGGGVHGGPCAGAKQLPCYRRTPAATATA